MFRGIETCWENKICRKGKMNLGKMKMKMEKGKKQIDVEKIFQSRFRILIHL